MSGITQVNYSLFRILFMFVQVMCGLTLGGGQLLGDALWLRTESEPKFGTVIRVSSADVLFLPFNANDSKAINYDRLQIELLVTNIDTNRLRKLTPPNWSAYRDYAEELAGQKRDPAARELAVRLYLIAAHGSSGDLRESCLVGLVALSENDKQRERWRMFQRLIVGAGDLDEPTTAKPDEIPESVARDLLQVLRLVRRGQQDEALRLMNEPDRAGQMRAANKLISIEQLKRIAALNRPTSEQLLQLLRIELAIMKRNNGLPANEDNWGVYAESNAKESVDIPSFKNVTRFDPEESIYRNGQWIRPGQ